ncbi:hypothetical protein [uncultured Clostridium sp.]
MDKTINEMFLNNEIYLECLYCGSLENVEIIDDEPICSCCQDRLKK